MVNNLEQGASIHYGGKMLEVVPEASSQIDAALARKMWNGRQTARSSKSSTCVSFCRLKLPDNMPEMSDNRRSPYNMKHDTKKNWPWESADS